MGKRIDCGEVLAWVEIDGVRYEAEVRERSAELVERRGPGVRKAKALPVAAATAA